MPYPNHALCVFGGGWVPSVLNQEIWTTSVRLNAGFTTGLPWNELVDEAADKVRAFIETNVFSDQVRCDYVKVNPIDETGRYAIEDDTFVHFYDVPPVGTRGGGLLPLQNTVVVTLLTARRRGIASKGRMYLPGIAPSEVDANGFLTASSQQIRADGTMGFLSSMRLWNAEYNGVPSVVSAGANGGAGDGVAEPILGLTVGNVVDTQRRRRNALTPESRLQVDLLDV